MDSSVDQSSMTAWSGFNGSGFGNKSCNDMFMQPFGPMGMPQQSFMNHSIVSQQIQEQHERTQHILGMKLGPEFLAQRAGAGGGKLTYIEGWRAINIANEVFGYNGWSSEVKSLEVDFIDQDTENGRFRMGVTAIVRVSLKDGTSREDCGYGKAEGVKSKGDALEKCKKEAITDATKRALRTFGNLLGNCLYDKNYVSEIGKMKAPKPKFSCSELYRGDGLDNIEVPRKASSSKMSTSGGAAAKPSAPLNISTNTTGDCPASDTTRPNAVVPQKRANPDLDRSHAPRAPPPQRQQSAPSAIPPHMRQQQSQKKPQTAPRAVTSDTSKLPPAVSPQPSLLPDPDISEIDYSDGMDDALFADVVAEQAGLMPKVQPSFDPVIPREISHPTAPVPMQQQQAQPKVPPMPRPQSKPVNKAPAPLATTSTVVGEQQGRVSPIPPPPARSGHSNAPAQEQKQPVPAALAPTSRSSVPQANGNLPPPQVTTTNKTNPVGGSAALPTIRRGPPAPQTRGQGAVNSKAAFLEDCSAGVQSPPEIEMFGADAGFGSARRLKRTYTRTHLEENAETGTREPLQALA